MCLLVHHDLVWCIACFRSKFCVSFAAKGAKGKGKKAAVAGSSESAGDEMVISDVDDEER